MSYIVPSNPKCLPVRQKNPPNVQKEGGLKTAMLVVRDIPKEPLPFYLLFPGLEIFRYSRVL